MSNNFSILSVLVKYRFRLVFIFAFLCLWTLLSWTFGTFADLLVVVALLVIFVVVAAVLVRTRRYGACARFIDRSVRIFFIPAVVLSCLLGFLATFVAYHALLAPAVFPALVLSNGDKTLVFQTMAHVASPQFYDDVRANVERAKRDGFVLFYEGVGPGTAENGRDFDRLLGLSVDEDFYDRFARVFGLVGQDNGRFLRLVNDRDRNVDLDIDAIMALVRSRLGSGGTLPAQATASGMLLAASGGLEQALADIRTLSSGARFATRWLGPAMINFSAKYAADELLVLAGAAEDGPERRVLLDAIIHDRDRHVADEVLRSPEKKIYLLYGLAHFDGIYAALRDADDRYRVVNSVEYHPFR